MLTVLAGMRPTATSSSRFAWEPGKAVQVDTNLNPCCRCLVAALETEL